MSRDDRHELPPDPAGTQPKVDPASLVPSQQNLLGPPSPPGPAASTAEAAVPGDHLPERVVSGSPPAPAEPRPEAPRRFHTLMAAIVAIGVVAIAAFAILVAVSDSGPEDSRPWSSWKPPAGDSDRATAAIARHVGPLYRTGSDQLAIVTGGRPSIEAAGFNGGPLPLHLILHDSGQNYTPINGNLVMYRICGLGGNCALAGTASADRLLLVRREALELALYSFRYIDGLDHVIVTLPPVVSARDAEAAAPQLLYFRRRDLDDELSRSLSQTLPGKTPPADAVKSSPGTKAVERTTASRIFSYAVEPSNSDNNAYLIVEQT